MIEVENARVTVRGEILSGIEAALAVLKRGRIEVSPKAFGVNPGFPIFIRSSTMSDLRRHKFFVSKSERRRLKKYAALKRERRRVARARQWSSRLMDPKEWRALKEYETLMDHRQKMATTNPTAEEGRSIGTVLNVIERRGKFLTLQDKEKGGMLGFVTGGINPDESLASASQRETGEESGLKIQLKEDALPFWRKNVSRSPIPYFMEGIYIKNPQGRLKTGDEIVPGSLKWRTKEEIDDLIISGDFIPNHGDFWNAFLKTKPEANNV